MKIKKSDILNFDIDYLEINGSFKGIKEIIKWLDSDNSNSRKYEGFTIVRDNDIKNFAYKIVFWKDDVTCFAYYEGQTLSECVVTNDYLVVYGKAFHIFSTAEIYDFVIEHLLDIRLRRLDLALDVKNDISKVCKNFKELKQKGSRFYDENGNIQTFYIWEKKNRLNKSLLIRVYDKLADIKQKELQFLYKEYLFHPFVTRVELEFRSELCKNFQFSNLLDRGYIFGLFITYILKHTNIFADFNDQTVAKLVRPKKDIDIESLEASSVLKKRYLNTFLGYSGKILELGNCPVDVLIRHGIISDTTIEDIGWSIEGGKFKIENYKFGITNRNVKQIFNGENTHDTD